MYDYYNAVKKDVRKYIENNITLSDYDDKGEFFQYLEETLWAEDSVTGNGSGSYTFNRYDAEENLCHNWDILEEIAEEWGANSLDFFNPETLDVNIRCYILNGVINEVLEEMNNNGELPEEWEEL